MVTLYERLCELCQEKGIKGARMCSDIGLSKSLMTDLKMGRTNGLNSNTLSKIATHFGVSVDYLLGKSEMLHTGDEELLSAETLASLSEDAKKPADQKASGLRGTGYDLLNDENRAVIDALIEKLYKSQFGE